MNDNKSYINKINCDVSQGYVLGPLLFIYINDISNLNVAGNRFYLVMTLVFF